MATAICLLPSATCSTPTHTRTHTHTHTHTNPPTNAPLPLKKRPPPPPSPHPHPPHLSTSDNTHGAEWKGSYVNFFGELDANGITTFYDSVCGLPLFRAPIGRSFAEWKKETVNHGWPSFRKEEMVAENVKFYGNEMRSACDVHLGHNLPDYSGDRYCINMVCMAGRQVRRNGTDSDPVSTSADFLTTSPFAGTNGASHSVGGGVVSLVAVLAAAAAVLLR